MTAMFRITLPDGSLREVAPGTTPADIAAAALYLASDEAEFVTGVELPVDGGRTV